MAGLRQDRDDAHATGTGGASGAPSPGEDRPLSSSTKGRGDSQPLSRRLGRRRGRWSVTLNLTPMIDVVFLLLFFFLVSSRFSTREGMLPGQLQPRAASAAKAMPFSPIQIHIKPSPGAPQECQVTIDKYHESPFPIAELAAELRRIQQPENGVAASTPVHLLAGDEIDWDHVVSAYNAALAAGYERILFYPSP